jgi:hypothetical protein
MTKNKYSVDVIAKDCKFYNLNNEAGKTLATIQYSGWKFHKYEVSFAFYAVKDNLKKGASFRTLKEAKEYVYNILSAETLRKMLRS